MFLSSEYLKRNEAKLLWYIVIIFSSCIPAIMRFIIGLDLNISKYDVKDVLFAGLAINLSNFNLINAKKLPIKSIFVTSSALLIAFIGMIIGVFLCLEAQTKTPAMHWLNVVSIGLVLGSAAVSYQANKFLF